MTSGTCMKPFRQSQQALAAAAASLAAGGQLLGAFAAAAASASATAACPLIPVILTPVPAGVPSNFVLVFKDTDGFPHLDRAVCNDEVLPRCVHPSVN